MSRGIDVVGQSDGSVLRADATGGAGRSCFGEDAFAAGAFGRRVALTVPIASGGAGAGVFRAVPGGSGARPLSGACAEQPRPGDAFGS
ncbi:hypothetical protein AB0420_33415 [Streptomyces caelestis]